MENKMKSEMGKQTRDAPFKRTVYADNGQVLYVTPVHFEEDTMEIVDAEGGAVLDCLDKDIPTKVCAAINAYSPERDAAVQGLVEALKYSRPLVAKWCHYQGDSKQFHNETLEPIDAAIAAYEGSK